MSNIDARHLENVVISNNVAFNIVQDGTLVSIVSLLSLFSQASPISMTLKQELKLETFSTFLCLLVLLKMKMTSCPLLDSSFLWGESFPCSLKLRRTSLQMWVVVFNYLLLDFMWFFRSSLFVHWAASYQVIWAQQCNYTDTNINVSFTSFQPTVIYVSAIFPNLSLRPELRAFHGSEIPIIFGTYNNSPIAPIPTEIEFSRYIQSVWVGFARNPKEGLTELGWPKYNPATASLAQLGGPANATGVVFTNPDNIDILCPNTSFWIDTLRGILALPSMNWCSFRVRFGLHKYLVISSRVI